MVDAMLKSKVVTILENLPPKGQQELEQFLDSLADKYRLEQKKKIVVLEGLWQDTPLNVTDEEVRQLREDVSKQLLKKLDNELSS
jgi:hypothetical protein